MSTVKEGTADIRARLGKVIRILRKEFPEASTALDFQDPYQILIATILSAQCTDERVNKVTPGLFKKYPDPATLSKAVQEELEQEIRSTGFFRAKSRNIIACTKALVDRHGGSVPKDFDALVALPGVGRKTANCVMGAAFGVNSGVVVDTHVQRLADRLGFSRSSGAVEIEQDLMAIAPQKDWYDLSNLLILHGRKTCNARKPLCENCPTMKLCPSGGDFLAGKKAPTKAETSARNRKAIKPMKQRRH